MNNIVQKQFSKNPTKNPPKRSSFRPQKLTESEIFSHLQCLRIFTILFIKTTLILHPTRNLRLWYQLIQLCVVNEGFNAWNQIWFTNEGYSKNWPRECLEMNWTARLQFNTIRGFLRWSPMELSVSLDRVEWCLDQQTRTRTTLKGRLTLGNPTIERKIT